METTKVALENERKIQQLQMQAINALWKKVSTLQPTSTSEPVPAPTIPPDNSSTAVVQDLAKTCSILTNQVSSGFGLFSLLRIHDIPFSCADFLNKSNNFANPLLLN